MEQELVRNIYLIGKSIFSFIFNLGCCMVRFFAQMSFLQLSITILLSVGVLFHVFIPHSIPFNISKYTVQIMFLYFLLGGMFLVIKQDRLSIVSWVGCAALCVFLKYAGGGMNFFEAHYARPTGAPQFRIACLNFTSLPLEKDVHYLTKYLTKDSADVLCIQEATPEWTVSLDSIMSTKYPYRFQYLRADFYGLVILSKYPLQDIDTLLYENVPIVHACIEIPNIPKKIQFFSMRLVPDMEMNSRNIIQHQLSLAGQYIQDNCMKKSVFAIGDFSLMQWDTDIQAFKKSSRLLSSRYDVDENMFGTYTDHIFHSPDFESIRFRHIKNGEHLGVMGIYQYKFTDYGSQKKTAEF